MPVISAEIMKTINERELQKKKKKTEGKQTKEQGDRSYSESVIVK